QRRGHVAHRVPARRRLPGPVLLLPRPRGAHRGPPRRRRAAGAAPTVPGGALPRLVSARGPAAPRRPRGLLRRRLRRRPRLDRAAHGDGHPDRSGHRDLRESTMAARRRRPAGRDLCRERRRSTAYSGGRRRWPRRRGAPVAVAPRPAQDRGVVVGFDGSRNAEEALGYGAAVAARRGCPLTVVTSYRPTIPGYPTDDQRPPDPEDVARRQQAEAVLEGAAERLTEHPGE